MASNLSYIQEELTQQVWSTPEPFVSRHTFTSLPESNEDQHESSAGSLVEPTIDKEDVGNTGNVYVSSDDEDFGDFETANTSSDDDSWISITYDDVEGMENGEADLSAYADESTFKNFLDSHSDSADLQLPSPLPRGYLRSTQYLKAFMHPMDLAAKSSTFCDFLSFESSTYNEYAPRVGPHSKATSSAQARHGTSAKRMWTLGKMAFTRLASAYQDPGKPAKHVLAAWTTNFVGKEHEELSRVVTTAGKVPMVVNTHAAIRQIRMSGNEASRERKHQSKESWMDEERQAWGE